MSTIEPDLFSSCAATQCVSFGVRAISEVFVEGGEVPTLLLSSVRPETGTFDEVRGSGVMVGWRSNGEVSVSLKARLDAELPQNMQLKMMISAPGGRQGTSTGERVVSSAAETVLVTGIRNSSSLHNSVTYVLTDTSSSGDLLPKQQGVRTVLLTIGA